MHEDDCTAQAPSTMQVHQNRDRSIRNGRPKVGNIRYHVKGTETGSVQYIHGKGMGSLVHELATNGVTTVHRFRHENQAGAGTGSTAQRRCLPPSSLTPFSFHQERVVQELEHLIG
ncbi:MAG: hypothetical protein IPK87_17080 [Planctomycetes bacterium]|nr:hypothetical protein [Planctomycetota bacterium]